jgi:hypothetical protein
MKNVFAVLIGLAISFGFYRALQTVKQQPLMANQSVSQPCLYHSELPFDRDAEQQKRNPGFGTTPELIANVERLRTTNPNDMGLYTNNQRALVFIINWQNNVQQPKSVDEALYLKSELEWWYNTLPYQFRDVNAESKFVTLETFIDHWIKAHYC